MPATKKTATKTTDKPKRDYPRLPIVTRLSMGSEGKNFQHGIGVVATGDPETNAPRISIGNAWFPEENGERHPAFMKSTCMLSLEDAEAFAKDIIAQVAAARKGNFVVTPRAEKKTTPPKTAAELNTLVQAEARKAVIASFVRIGMSEAAAEAAYEQSRQPATAPEAI